MRTVSLVLGSGGARGLAHIGVIRWLEENGYEIRSISGSSIGAMIGGIYAAGRLKEFEEWAIALNRLDLIALMDIAWQKNGIFKGDKIIDTLKGLVGDQQIETLPIPFTAVATDISAEKEIWIDSGNLFDAIRASISLPMFFTPHLYRGMHLIDGGVLNPVPIAPTFSDDTEMTIAVNLGGAIDPSTKKSNDAKRPLQSALRSDDTILGFIKGLATDITKKSTPDKSVYEIANQAFDSMQSTIARHKLAAYPPDHTIEIARDACGMLEFDRAEEMISLGYRKAEEGLSSLAERSV